MHQAPGAVPLPKEPGWGVHWASASHYQAWEDGRVIWSSPAVQVRESLLIESGNFPVRRGLRGRFERNVVNLEENKI